MFAHMRTVKYLSAKRKTRITVKSTSRRKRRQMRSKPGSFADLLRRYLDALPEGVSVLRFAKSVGSSRSMFSDILSGRRSPPLDKIDSWADGFDLKGLEREQFLLAARSMRAKGKVDSTDYIDFLEGRVKYLEGSRKVWASVLREVIALAEERGVPVPQHHKHFLVLLDEPVYPPAK